jgi:chemotaxis protein MotB
MAGKGAKQAQSHGKDDRPKVIIKKAKGHHGGHHGGAWKVAYADFVTAMMALFLVLWLLGASNSQQKAVIAHYFREPGVFSGSRGIIPHGGEDKLGAGIIQAPSMEVLQMHIKEGLANLKDLVDLADQIPMKITDEGLLIEVIDKDKQAFFDLSSAAVKPLMRKVLGLIVKEIKDATNKVVISGHTDARPFQNAKNYSNWDLSTERALNTRRTLEELGLAPDRVEKVAGYADRQLRVPNDPLSSENRRISILIRRADKTDAKLPKSSP